VLKIARYPESLQLLGRVLLSRRSELFITLVAVLVLLVISSTFMYYAEREAQPRGRCGSARARISHGRSSRIV